MQTNNMEYNNYPSYYAIIPAEVRYDPRLSADAKLLYGEITCLTHKTGECWASDNYFMKLYNVSKSTMQRWLKELKDCGYITSELQYKEGSKEVEKRLITIAIGRPQSIEEVESAIEGPISKNDNRPIVKNDNRPISKNDTRPIVKNDTDNNINNNNINYNKKDEFASSDRSVINYINKLNYDADTMSALNEWYYKVAKNRAVTVKQLKSILAAITESVNGNEIELSKSIKQATENNWMAFYKDTRKVSSYRLSQSNNSAPRQVVVLGTEEF